MDEGCVGAGNGEEGAEFLRGTGHFWGLCEVVKRKLEKRSWREIEFGIGIELQFWTT